MSVRTESKVLALMCVFFGVLYAQMIPKISSICGNLGLGLPFFTRVIFSPGAAGWSLAFGVVAGIVLWKDSWKRLRVPNSIFAITLATIVWTLLAGFLPPIIEIFRFAAD